MFQNGSCSGLLLLVLFVLAGCEVVTGEGSSDFGIQPLPSQVGARLGSVSVVDLRREGFTKCVSVAASDRGAIWIVAQPGVRDLAVARARNILMFYLSPAPGSSTDMVAQKRAVAAQMIANDALLMMPTGAHVEGDEPDLPAQPLYESETPVDGSRWYIDNDWEHRDAAFEEIFYLVYDTGIGTDVPGAMPEYQVDLDREARAAIRDGRWGGGDVQDWLRELEQEGSLAQEYIASVIDTYYGLWGAFDERKSGMWGIYCAKDREEQVRKDPAGQKLLERFLPPFLYGYEALIDDGFAGTFSMTFDPGLLYTHKSRYLVDVQLTGANSSGVLGNEQNNQFAGNAGNNHFDGMAGHDTVRFRGRRSDYDFVRDDDGVVVEDRVAGRDGCDRLLRVEVARFVDGDLLVAAIR